MKQKEQLTRSEKNDKINKEISVRFVKAMKAIIAEKIASGEKYSVSKLADSLGYSRMNLVNVANRLRPPTRELIVGICWIHDISPNWLIKGVGEMKLGKIEKQNGKKLTLEERVKRLEGIVIKKAAH